MSEEGAVWRAAMAERDGDPETYLSWTDDGVVLQCERETCKVRHSDGRLYWYQEGLPYKVTPEMAGAARDAHVAWRHDDHPDSREWRQ